MTKTDIERLYTGCLTNLRAAGRINLVEDRYVELFRQVSGANGAAQDVQTVAKTKAQIREYLGKEGALFETRDIDLLPEPYIFSSDLVKQIESKFSILHGIVEKIYDLYVSSKEVKAFFNLSPVSEELIKLECHSRPLAYLCRYDFTLTQKGTPRIYELNAACPAAFVFSRHFYNAVSGSPLFKFLQNTVPFEIQQFPNQKSRIFMRRLAEIAQKASGQALKQVNIGLINSRYNTLVNELTVMEKEGFEEGFTPVRSFVEDLTFKDNQLWAQGIPLSVAFGKFHPRYDGDFELPFTKHRKEGEALLRAISNGMPFVNSFASSSLIESKSVLAFLRSNLSDPIVTPSERDLINEIIPDTKLLSSLSREEMKECLSGKDKFVLKKSLDSRGSGVVIGCDTNSADWHANMKMAHKARAGEYILQGYESPEVCISGGRKLYTSHACFLLGGVTSGMFTRTAQSNITNVGSGGSVQVPLIMNV